LGKPINLPSQLPRIPPEAQRAEGMGEREQSQDMGVSFWQDCRSDHWD
jgi:hypothetical protein